MGVYRQKHYEMFAAVIKRAKAKAATEARAIGLIDPTDIAGPSARLGVAVVQNEVIKLFRDDDPRFKDLLFIEACGTGDEDASPPKP